MPEQAQKILANLQSFGAKRLAIMAAVAAIVMGVIGVASVYLNNPAYETLYVGLERSDVNQIGLVLSEAGIGFDVGSDGTTVLVPAGKTAAARMLLAEKGLPTSANAGYELFDNVGSLGLTSFMQQITRVRALEGEIARTIQSINGIKAARVHIVHVGAREFPPRGAAALRLRRDPRLRHRRRQERDLDPLPGRGRRSRPRRRQGDVLDSSGTLLAAGDDPNNNSANRSLGVERTVETQIEDNIRRALAPYLGPDNFRASVKAEVNTDARQSEETIFDPNSRVERSIQVVKANENSNQSNSSTPASSTRTCRRRRPPPRPGRSPPRRTSARRDHQLRDNSKKVSTISNGYSLTKMSIAVVVNQQRLADILARMRPPRRSRPASPTSRRW